MMKRMLLTLISSVLLQAAVAESPNADSYGTELPFVIGIGARASGMGLAYTSLKGDPAVQYFNPAGLADAKWKQFQLFRTVLFDSRSLYHTASYTHPTLNYGSFGLSILRFDISGIEERDINNQLISDDLKNAQMRLLLGYGKSLHPKFAAGFNLKIDNHSFGNASGSGVGLDIGFVSNQQRRDGRLFKEVREALAVQNIIEPTIKLDQDKVADPLQVVFGISAISEYDNVGFVTSIDLVNPRFSPFSFRLGQEVMLYDHFFLRAGFDHKTPTFGFGASLSAFAVDYAYRDEDLGSNHRISLSISFGSSTDESRERARRELEQQINAEINRKMNRIEEDQITRSLQEADSLYHRAEYEGAIDACEIVLYWDPDNEHARSRLTEAKYHVSLREGLALMEQKDCLQAIYHFRQALSNAPDDSTATSLIRACEQKLSESKDRAVLVDQLLKKGIDLYADQRFPDALLAFEEILKIQPSNPLAQEYRQKTLVNIENAKQRLILRSRTHAQKRDYDGAIGALEEVLSLTPNDQMVLTEIATLREKRTEALAAAGREAQQDFIAESKVTRREKPDLDMETMEGKYRKGMQYFEDGEFEKATRSFMELWAIDPEFHNVSTLLTKAYLLMGMQLYSLEEYEKAIDVWEKALKVDPNNIKAKRFLMKTKGEMEKLGGVSSG